MKGEVIVMAGKIEEARRALGMSRAEMSRQFEIPVRTLEDWDAGARKCPVWAERLILEKLERMKNEMESRED